MVLKTRLNKQSALQAIVQSRYDFFRIHSITHILPYAQFDENDKRAVYITGIPFAVFNGVIMKDEKYSIPENEVDVIMQKFQSSKMPFMWWGNTNGKLLESKGFQFGGVMKGIHIDISSDFPEISPHSSKLAIKQVKNGDELTLFCSIAALCFALGDKHVLQMARIMDLAQTKGKLLNLMAYWDGKPVSTLSLSTMSNSSGIWNFTTLPEYRRQGIGSALIYAAIKEAKKFGYASLTGILMPKGLAASLVKKFGAHEICDMPFYVYGCSPDSIEK